MKKIFIFIFLIFISGCSDSFEKIEISDLKVEENPENVLSCMLSFKTDRSIETVVRYFSDDHSGYEIQGAETTDHYFFIWGMRADSTYNIQIFSAKDLEHPVYSTTFNTGVLPGSLPALELTENKPEKVSDGFVLFTYYNYPEEFSKPVALMVDTEGEIVWYFEYYMAGFNVIGNVQFVDETQTVMISISKGPNMADIPAEEAIEIDLEGNVIWKSAELKSVHNGPDNWHHMYRLLDDDSIVTLKPDYIGNVVSDRILNLDRDYNVLWSWRYGDVLEVPECPAGEICDWTHSNHVNMFKEKKTCYINSRNFSKYFKIDMDSGKILWTFGKDGDFSMTSAHPDPWIEFAHAPQITFLNDNESEILFYDNGSDERGFSRIIKYRIDEEKLTSEIIFEYDGSNENKKWSTPFWGSAREMENGNFFITAGNFEFSEKSRIFEVTDKGETVWELVLLEPDEDVMIALYNSWKFKPDLKKLVTR